MSGLTRDPNLILIEDSLRTQTVLPESLKMPLLKALHCATHHGTYKMIQIMKKYWWGDCSKVTIGLQPMSDLSDPSPWKRPSKNWSCLKLLILHSHISWMYHDGWLVVGLRPVKSTYIFKWPLHFLYPNYFGIYVVFPVFYYSVSFL